MPRTDDDEIRERVHRAASFLFGWTAPDRKDFVDLTADLLIDLRRIADAIEEIAANR